jgi:predicted transcriptional regulator
MPKTKKPTPSEQTKATQKEHTMTVRLDSDTFTAFDKVCDELGYSKSFVVRELIKKYVSNKQHNLF